MEWAEYNWQMVHMARNFYWSTFFGQIFNRNNLTYKKARVLRKEYFNRSIFRFLDFKITSYLVLALGPGHRGPGRAFLARAGLGL